MVKMEYFGNKWNSLEINKNLGYKIIEQLGYKMELLGQKMEMLT